MLNAFTARPIVELKQRDKSKIESILTYGDRLLVGLNTGCLRIYRVNDAGPENVPTTTNSEANEPDTAHPTPRAVDLLREEEKFSRKPVQQLAIIKEANILVSLSESYVSIYDLQTYTLSERLERTKGASCFAVTSNIVKDPNTGIPSIVSKLAVAVKRQLLVWIWQDMELEAEVVEITLRNAIKSLTWATGSKMIAGMDAGFVLINVESMEILDIIKGSNALATGEVQEGVRFGGISSSGMGYMTMSSWVPKPLATKLGEGQLLLSKDVNTLFIDETGKDLEKRQVPWAYAPEAIGYSYPYLLALQSPSKGIMEVRNPDTLSLLQSVQVPSASTLHVPQPNISLAHAGKGFLVSSDRTIWRMSALSYDTQIDELASQGRYDEAISLLGMLEETLLKDKEGRIREFKILKAQGLFNRRKYREAFELFGEAAAPPQRVIAPFPKSIAADLAEEEPEGSDEADGGSVTIDGSSEPTQVAAKAVPSQTPSSSTNKSMLGRLQRKPDSSDTSSVKSMASESPYKSKGSPTDKSLEGKDLVVAVKELCRFLVGIHGQLITKYLHTNGTLRRENGESPADFVSRRPPFRHLLLEFDQLEPSEYESKLHETAILVDTTLFRGYMLASPSLAGSLFRLPNWCDPAVVKEKLYESGRYGDLIDFLHGKRLHREALELLEKFGKDEADEAVNPALKGPHRTVAYLQQLPPSMIDLILEFAEWPIRADEKLGMEVFLADSENAETLPRDRVVEFLKGITTSLAVRYLEHVIHELDDQTSQFHQQLIDLYLKRLQAKDGEGQEEFASQEERTEWVERLQVFLRTSTQYSKARVFKHLPTDDPEFFECRAIVLSKMGQHKQALQIYVFQMQDHDRAEEYCNQTFLSRQADPSDHPSKPLIPSTEADNPEISIYHVLLALYLTPPPPHKPNFGPALALVSKHGARLPAASTIDLIPSSLPVNELESYFRGRIRSDTSLANEERVAARLRGVQKVAVDDRLLLGERNRRVVIQEERLCSVCHKRFGSSAIRVYPNNTVVHYGCSGAAAARVGGERGQRWGL
ncbi:hypothetical protein P152DRAFT_341522 [Eremomyces bilateralis CBS 781.70]|uniref:CNH domain-containing protein n=1 Tax=Eremomyces bilateralis CBS 781.70 TaxID=1392243 RepID=A0A6G1G3L1_9PEZI|nr:uncharacterized protein P152DRAFT_341522 [Eremomyces bilateralis CBS 781.70]KAF1812500.1 hypothetical protein P152DRAFT_341522 [Eremomyces bilateralis CBS 781.70]